LDYCGIISIRSLFCNWHLSNRQMQQWHWVSPAWLWFSWRDIRYLWWLHTVGSTSSQQLHHWLWQCSQFGSCLWQVHFS
jgi:hypothetical protein